MLYLRGVIVTTVANRSYLMLQKFDVESVRGIAEQIVYAGYDCVRWAVVFQGGTCFHWTIVHRVGAILVIALPGRPLVGPAPVI